LLRPGLLRSHVMITPFVAAEATTFSTKWSFTFHTTTNTVYATSNIFRVPLYLRSSYAIHEGRSINKLQNDCILLILKIWKMKIPKYTFCK